MYFRQMYKKWLTIALVLGGCFLRMPACAQQGEPEEIGAAEDKFRDKFFEALRQKAIGNYDKAITYIEECLKLQPDNPALFNEIGRNQLLAKHYKEAYEAFEKASQLDPANRWYLNGMYDVAYETQDWNRAIGIVTKLIPFDDTLKEDLVSLYMNTKQFDKALALINELNATVGHSEKRDLYKADILSDPKYAGSEKDDLLARIKTDPQDEAAYLELMSLYSNSGQEAKATEIAKQLEKAIPASDWAQVSLFRNALAANDGDRAVTAMNQLLKSTRIDSKIKHRVINEFLLFTQKNPQYADALAQATALFGGDQQAKTAKEIGKFYQGKGDWKSAASYYEKEATANPADLENTLLLLQAYAETAQFDKMNTKAAAAIELYPMQPELYYYGGLAFNQLKQFAKAKDLLLTGVDYIVDSVPLEANFNIQIGEAYHGLGDEANKEKYFLKADKLLNKKK